MEFTKKGKVFAATLALCAILLNAGWPLLAKAMSGTPSTHSDICTSSPQGSSGGAGKLPVVDFTAHCAFCSLASDKVLPATHAHLERIESAGGHAIAKRGSSSNQAAPLFSSAAPRGPPTFS